MRHYNRSRLLDKFTLHIIHIITLNKITNLNVEQKSIFGWIFRLLLNGGDSIKRWKVSLHSGLLCWPICCVSINKINLLSSYL